MPKKIYKFIPLLWLVLTFSQVVYSVEQLPSNLQSLTSAQGATLLKKNLNLNTVKLLEHFTTEKTTTYCGAASAVMVLNSINIVLPNDPEHPSYKYFTQDNFFNEKVEKIIKPKAVKINGMTLTQLGKAIRLHGVEAEIVFANEIALDTFRKKLKLALSNEKFIIANFSRAKLGQLGDGHHSPVAGYDEATDQFLILDVARYKYPAFWVKTSDLWSAVNTRDGNFSRGILIIEPA